MEDISCCAFVSRPQQEAGEGSASRPQTSTTVQKEKGKLRRKQGQGFAAVTAAHVLHATPSSSNQLKERNLTEDEPPANWPTWDMAPGQEHISATEDQLLIWGKPQESCAGRLGPKPPNPWYPCPQCGNYGGRDRARMAAIWVMTQEFTPGGQRWEWQCACGLNYDCGSAYGARTPFQAQWSRRLRHWQGAFNIGWD